MAGAEALKSYLVSLRRRNGPLDFVGWVEIYHFLHYEIWHRAPYLCKTQIAFGWWKDIISIDNNAHDFNNNQDSVYGFY